MISSLHPSPDRAAAHPLHLAPDAHERNMRAIQLQAQAEILFDRMRHGTSSPDLLLTSLSELEANDLTVFCRAIQKQIEQAKK